MTADNRLHFETELLKELKLISSRLNGVVATKNKLKFKYKKNMWPSFILLTFSAPMHTY